MNVEDYGASLAGHKAFIEELRKTAKQVVENCASYESNSTLLGMARRNMVQCYSRVLQGATVIITALDDVVLDMATIAQLKGPATTRRFFMDDDGVLKEGTLEECARREGISVEEYLAKEAEEIASAQEFFEEGEEVV